MNNDEAPRLTAQEIYEHAVQAGRDELERPAGHIAFSGLAGGFVMGLSGLGVALMRSYLGDGELAKLASFALYPAGFVAVIIGRAQLFTENTLYPVVLSLEELRYALPTLRLWAVVFFANVAGALVFAVLVTQSGALPVHVEQTLATLGHEVTLGGFWDNFWSGVLAGWLIALVAWLVEASGAAVGRILVIAALITILNFAHLDHCIASGIEAFAGAMDGRLGAGAVAYWLTAVTCGNAVGGVLIVSLFNFAQVRAGGEAAQDVSVEQDRA